MFDVRDFGAKGDGQADDTEAIRRCVNEGGGPILLSEGTFRITEPIEISLGDRGRTGLCGAGGCARILMTGSGPALHFLGTHEGTASPETFTPNVNENERMPLISGIEIAGAHPEADGIRLEGLWQPTVTRVSIHDCRHGLHVVKRNRNLIVGESHIYNNRGVGVFYDHLDLHQSNICNCHISYNKRGGIKVLESGIRNLQICGNDIEYNFDSDADESADVWIETLTSSIREGTIVGNTIQAVRSPGGANVRFRGLDENDPRRAGNWTISGNLISNQDVNVHLQYCRGIVISGNSFFSGHERTLQAERCEGIVIGPNSMDRHPDYRADAGGGVLLRDCVGCSMTGLLVAGARSTGPDWRAAVEVVDSREISITGCQVLDSEPCGVRIENSRNCLVSSCTILDRRDPTVMTDAVTAEGGENNLVAGNLK